MDYKDCERCGGRGEILGYKHINNGICYECDGLGYVESGHVYKHHRGSRIEKGTMSGPARKSKKVNIPGLGAGDMSTYNGTRFSFSMDSCPFGSGCHFTIKGGRVCEVDLENGMIQDGYKVPAVRQALQTALRR
jgi:hypothetical protein